MRKYSKKDRKKPAYKTLLAKLVAVAKEAFECEELLKEMFEIQVFASQDL